ncbi:MAG TPA: hypothetical protein VG692_05755, partial [Gemmatimonadales bacterium]|nr:hypothetical protein [Gemmatimonadales bacterium]
MPTTILRLFLQAVGLLAGLFGALLLVDLWRASRPDAHATYHFGAEAMIAHGGAKYASQAAYLADAVPMTLL